MEFVLVLAEKYCHVLKVENMFIRLYLVEKCKICEMFF